MAKNTKPRWNLLRHRVAQIVQEARHGDWIARPGKYTLWRDLRSQLAAHGLVVAWFGAHLLIVRENVLKELATLREVARGAIHYDTTALAMFHDLLQDMDLSRTRERERWLLNGFRATGGAPVLPLPGGDIRDGKRVKTRLEKAGRSEVLDAFEDVCVAKLSRRQRELLRVLLELDRDDRGASLKLLRPRRATRSVDAVLSRSLRRLAARGLVKLIKSPTGRTVAVRLTAAGRFMAVGRRPEPPRNG